MSSAKVVALILSLQAGMPNEAKRTDLASLVAPVLVEEAERNGIDPRLIVALIWAESRWLPHVRSKGGDMGLGQIRRGAATKGHSRKTDAQLMDPELNLRLTVRWMAVARDLCGGNPERWLTAYGSGTQCGSSKYSRSVLQWMRLPAFSAVPR